MASQFDSSDFSSFARRPNSAAGTGTRILRRCDVRQLLSLEDTIEAVEGAFRAHAEGRSIPPGVLGAPVAGGGFHIKAAGLTGSPGYYAVKINGNFYRNATDYGLPRIQGLIILSDSRNGSPLAVMDSTYVTEIRTAAASAVAAKYLSTPEAAEVTIVGCGLQGRVQLAAIRCVRPIKRANLYDFDPSAAARLAAELSGIEVQVVGREGLQQAIRSSAICVTCTPSQTPLLGLEDLSPGTFVAAVGADSEDKQELEVEVLRRSRIVVDHLEQCATIGELHHALEAGAVTRADVHADLSEIVTGRKPGRTRAEEIFVFDSTGVALQDVAAAALVYERAVAAGAGTLIQVNSK